MCPTLKPGLARLTYIILYANNAARYSTDTQWARTGPQVIRDSARTHLPRTPPLEEPVDDAVDGRDDDENGARQLATRVEPV